MSTTFQTGRRVAAARAAIENLRPAELAVELGTRAVRPVLLDVRGTDEHRAEAISGAINVPRGTIETAIDGVAQPDSRIVVYCDSGSRSALAAAALYAIGYHDVAQLDGGLDAWRAAGLPVIAATNGG